MPCIPHNTRPVTSPILHLQSIFCFVLFPTVFAFFFLGHFQPSRAGAVQVSAPECILAQGRGPVNLNVNDDVSDLHCNCTLSTSQSGQSSFFVNKYLTGNPGERTFLLNICHHHRASESGTPRIHLQFLEL